jgi:PAS domain S-box-containing protein
VTKEKFHISLVRWLIHPLAPIHDRARFRQSKLLSAVLLGFALASLLYSVIQLLLEPGFLAAFYWINGTCLVMLTAYWLSRLGHYHWATAIGLVTISISILFTSLFGPGATAARNLFVMIMPMVLASMLLAIRQMVYLFVFNLAAMTVMTIFNPAIPWSEALPALAGFVTTTFMVLIFIRHRDHIENDRQEELKKKEEQYRNLVENINDIIYTLDEEGRFTFVSPAIERVTQYKTGEMIGRHFSGFVLPEDLPGLTETLGQVYKGRSEQVEFRFRDKDNRMLHARGSGQGIVEDGKIVGVTGVITDITAQKKLEDQLQQARKMESIGRLAGGVAHDFNNLLTVILGHSDLMLHNLDDSESNSGTKDSLTGIKTAAERAAALTRQLLAFSRKQPMEPKLIDINGLVSNMEKMLRRLIGEHILLETHYEEGVHQVHTDPSQMQQVIMNLAVNAADAMPRGGKLVLETHQVQLDESYCSQHGDVKPGDYVMLAVSDTGSGIDPETAKYIFEPFFTTKDPGKGTGLGLSTVYGAVKQNQGHIWFYSEAGKGTTFKVYFPGVPDRGDNTQEEESLTGGRFEFAVKSGIERVMVVEDEEGLRDVMSQVLEGCGYYVFTAANGREALEWLQKHRDKMPDLLVTDIVMPEMNGKDLADHVLRMKPGIKVLYISGYTETTLESHGLNPKHIRFLAKPFSPIKLAQKVRDVLDAP